MVNLVDRLILVHVIEYIFLGPGPVVDVELVSSFDFELEIDGVESDDQVVLHFDGLELLLLHFLGQHRPDSNGDLDVLLLTLAALVHYYVNLKIT